MKNISQFQTHGSVVESFINGLGQFSELGQEILRAHGIVDLDASKWYSLSAFKLVLDEVAKNVGERTMYSIGLSLPDSVTPPKDVTNLATLLMGFDHSYHLTHAINGTPLFNIETGLMVGGIGHYYFKHISQNSGIMEGTLTDIYHPELCRGIITAWGRKFEPLLEVTTLSDTMVEGNRTTVWEIRW